MQVEFRGIKCIRNMPWPSNVDTKLENHALTALPECPTVSLREGLERVALMRLG